MIGEDSLKNPKRFAHALRNLPWTFNLRSPLTDRQQTSIRRILKPSLAVGEFGTLSPLQEMLSEEAVEIAESGTVRLVRGVAGSGKSLVLVRRAQYIKEVFPDFKILAMSFNDELKKDLRWRIDDPDIEVKTFHSVCSQIIREANRKWRSPNELRGWLQRFKSDFIEENDMTVDFVHEEIGWRKDIRLNDNEKYLTFSRTGRGKALRKEQRMIINDIFDDYRHYQEKNRRKGHLWEDWHDVPYIAFDALKETKSHSMLRNYDVIMLDEAQDFAPTWIDIVKKLIKRNGTLFVCDDPTQSLFRDFSWKMKGIDMRGRSRILRVPFRSTRQISKAAHALVEADPLLYESNDITKPILDSPELLDGDLPLLVECTDSNDEIEFIRSEIESLIDTGVDGNEIAVLCHKKGDVRKWAALRNKLGITVTKFEKMKGLEYRAVFVPCLNTAFDSSNEDEKDDYFESKRRKRIFTLMTRARQILVLSYCERFPSELASIGPYVYREYR